MSIINNFYGTTTDDRRPAIRLYLTLEMKRESFPTKLGSFFDSAGNLVPPCPRLSVVHGTDLMTDINRSVFHFS